MEQVFKSWGIRREKSQGVKPLAMLTTLILLRDGLLNIHVDLL